MPSRARSICRATRCNKLIKSPGYCEDHQHLANPFKRLDKKKTPEAKKFYSSYKWTMASKRHRIKSPLCMECARGGITKAAQMVHHIIEVQDLWKQGLNPLDDKYLESLCNNCHQKHLVAKRL
jgi:5-methylcytosine-specific restriction endonuclease McrA